jgi:hypothetical protein
MLPGSALSPGGSLLFVPFESPWLCVTADPALAPGGGPLFVPSGTSEGCTPIPAEPWYPVAISPKGNFSTATQLIQARATQIARKRLDAPRTSNQAQIPTGNEAEPCNQPTHLSLSANSGNSVSWKMANEIIAQSGTNNSRKAATLIQSFVFWILLL